ncbi:hypothetical protein NAEGRDRAFT_46748 [Naegleria gruberi]|uniref:Uncharacterized protein n=1 Tax=Naegleria gruberi TaxID=5762 RepID=D2V4Y8_NAEGR|nr:uncharacterized protein NAEGRDRAFT_46748 [Naegleria gruberi]EFC48186.1 hypothetical protein NAEGRDRAFT_46748 [Naegleria gruberi]|eukprot:XP_002680930.1 hypothetical protein NAEGRDRAFT_46748 [Naegleria gruberi strain NEG-M]
MAQTCKSILVFIEGACDGNLLEESKHEEMDRIASIGGTTLVHGRKLFPSSIPNSTMINNDCGYLMQLFDYLDPIHPVDEEEANLWKENPELELEKQSLFCKFKKLKVEMWTTNNNVLNIFKSKKDNAKFLNFIVNNKEEEDAICENAVQAMLSNDILILHDNITKLQTIEEKRNHIQQIDHLLKQVNNLFTQKQNQFKIYNVILVSTPFNSVLPSFNKKSSPFRPLQSYEQKNGTILTDIVHHEPSLICVQHCEGETRSDTNTQLTEKSSIELNGNCAILIDFVISEMAYKLRKSPKYGA